MTVVLGIDIGGTHSRAHLVRDGNIVLSTQSSSASPTANGQANARAALHQLLSPIRQACADSRIVAACVGSAGGEAASTQRFLSAELHASLDIDRLSIISDGDLILPAAGRREGVAVIAGTGSVAVGFRGGTRVQAGGWGYLLGDEGGGYWTVREAMRAVLVKPSGTASALEGALCSALAAHSRAELLQRLYEQPAPQAWAKHAAIVYAVAADGDVDANMVVGRAAQSLGDLALSALNQLPHPVPVVLAGGVLTSQPRLAADVAARLTAAGHPDTAVLKRPPVEAAVLIAEQLARAATPT